MSDQWVGSVGQVNTDPDPEVLAESALAMAQATIQNAIDKSGVSRAEIARRMDASRSFITRLLGGSHNLTVKTMARCLAAAGYEVEFGLTPIRWNWADVPPPTIEYATVPSSEGTLLFTIL